MVMTRKKHYDWNGPMRHESTRYLIRCVIGNLTYFAIAIILQWLCMSIDEVIPFDLAKVNGSMAQMYALLSYREDISFA